LFWCLVTGVALMANVAIGQTRAVNGHYGLLGEWELTASLIERNDGPTHVWSGPLRLRHVGLCSADGPEEKTGELRLTTAAKPGVTSVTLLFEGVACTFIAGGSDVGEGVLSCPDRRDVPMMLTIE
jgi:hypothetical protein